MVSYARRQHRSPGQCHGRSLILEMCIGLLESIVPTTEALRYLELHGTVLVHRHRASFARVDSEIPSFGVLVLAHSSPPYHA